MNFNSLVLVLPVELIIQSKCIVNLYHSGQIQQTTNKCYFSYFCQKVDFDITCKLSPSQKIDFDIPCKLSPEMSKSLFWGKIRN